MKRYSHSLFPVGELGEEQRLAVLLDVPLDILEGVAAGGLKREAVSSRIDLIDAALPVVHRPVERTSVSLKLRH